MKMNKMAMALLLGLSLLPVTAPAQQEGEKQMEQRRDMIREQQRNNQEVLLMLKETMTILKDLNRTPSADQKKKLDEMINSLDAIVKKQQEMMKQMEERMKEREERMKERRERRD